MDGQQNSSVERLKGVWGGLKIWQRAAIIGGLVTAIVVALVASLWTQTPDYATLFSGLSEEDAANVVEQLKTAEIPYRLAQGGSVIQVPERQVYETRLEMAKQGLPKGSTVGFELFDSGQLGNLGMTDFMQRVNYQRALEGELARTIASLDPVASARVHLVIPEQSLFTAQQRDPTASIVLQLKPRAGLTREHVRAITNLVASSVEGLQASNITLVDMQGNVLAAAGEEARQPAGLQASSSQLETQRSYERDMENRLQTMLDEAVGANHAIVRVSATLNWDQKQVNSETYAAPSDGSGVLRSEQTQEEATSGNGTWPGGVPGVDSNTQAPSYPVAGTQITTSGTVKRNTTRNYEVSKVVQTVTQAPGTVQRLAVAVLLDQALPQETADRIQTMVATAAGLDTSRGDTASVQRISFADQSGAAQASAAQTERNQQVLDLARLAIMVLVVLIILRFVWLIFRDLSRRLSGEYVPYVKVIGEQEVPQALRAQQAAPQLAEASAAVPELTGQRAEGAGQDIPELPLSDMSPVRRHLMDLAARRPDLISDLLQAWLTE